MFFYNQIIVLDLGSMGFVSQMDIVLPPDDFLLLCFCSVPLILGGQTTAMGVGGHRFSGDLFCLHKSSCLRRPGQVIWWV